MSSAKMNGSSTPGHTTPEMRLCFETLLSPWTARSVGVALDLGLVEALCQKQDSDSAAGGSESGSMSLSQLGAVAGCKNGTGNLLVVLRCIARAGFIEEVEAAEYVSAEKEAAPSFRANHATHYLRCDLNPSAGDLYKHLVNDEKWLSLLMLPAAVVENKVAFELVHGMDVYEYGEGDKKYESKALKALNDKTFYSIGTPSRRDEFRKEFMRAMTFFSKHSIGDLFSNSGFDWSSLSGTVMDVGGGHGKFLASVMREAPDVERGILFDRQWVVDSVPKEMFEDIKKQRTVDFVVGDVLDPFPIATTVDVVMMKHFLSAFSDSKATTILKNIRAVLTPKTGRVLLLQTLVTEGADQDPLCDDGVAPAAFAVEIMCDCPGGRWRTGREYRVLFERAGFFECCRVKAKPNMTLIVYGLK